MTLSELKAKREEARRDLCHCDTGLRGLDYDEYDTYHAVLKTVCELKKEIRSLNRLIDQLENEASKVERFEGFLNAIGR